MRSSVEGYFFLPTRNRLNHLVFSTLWNFKRILERALKSIVPKGLLKGLCKIAHTVLNKFMDMVSLRNEIMLPLREICRCVKNFMQIISVPETEDIGKLSL